MDIIGPQSRTASKRVWPLRDDDTHTHTQIEIQTYTAIRRGGQGAGVDMAGSQLLDCLLTTTADELLSPRPRKADPRDTSALGPTRSALSRRAFEIA